MSSGASCVATRIHKAGRWRACAATKGAEKMKRSVASTETTNRKMVQQSLPFEEPLQPGWQGKRYLLCSDGKWHLVLRILDGDMADTQCCEDVYVVLPPPTNSKEPMCATCTSLHFAPKK